MSVSLDGFVAGPDQSIDNPLGIGGRAVHEWHMNIGEHSNDVDRAFADNILAGKGAYVMGRNMFGPVRGDWPDDSWRGWWGEEPPYHAPVFVLTHYAREPLEMAGGTTFYFVTEGFDAALPQARAAAGDLDVDIAGGASAVRQALQAGVVDELVLDIAPVLLHRGERMFDDVGDITLTPIEVGHSPLATHIRYRVGR